MLVSPLLTRRDPGPWRGGEGSDALLRPKATAEKRDVGLVVKGSASTAEDPGFDSRLRRDISGVESCQ